MLMRGPRMMESLLSRSLQLLFGYAYPAYECFKCLEEKKPQVDQLLFWCRYWIIVAFVTAMERIGGVSISWLPLYGEAKLVFFIYLWHQKAKGRVYLYDHFFRAYLAKHELGIDQKLLEIRVRSPDLAVLLWRKVIYGLTSFCESFRSLSSQLPSMAPEGQEHLKADEEKIETDTSINKPSKPRILSGVRTGVCPPTEASHASEMNQTDVTSHDPANLPSGENEVEESMKDLQQTRHSRWRIIRSAFNHLKQLMSCCVQTQVVW